VLLESTLKNYRLFARGKVRDVYEDGDCLLIVATDRISAFDYILPTGIPDKQQLVLVEKSKDGKLSTREILPVRFSELDEGADTAGAA